MKPEQTSNVKSREPIGMNNREGRWSPWEHPTDDQGFVRRGRGVARPHSTQGNTGDPVRWGRTGLAPSSIRVEPGGKSEGLIVPHAPDEQHNRQGGKESWFEVRLDESRSRRLA